MCPVRGSDRHWLGVWAPEAPHLHTHRGSGFSGLQRQDFVRLNVGDRDNEEQAWDTGLEMEQVFTDTFSLLPRYPLFGFSFLQCPFNELLILNVHCWNAQCSFFSLTGPLWYVTYPGNPFLLVHERIRWISFTCVFTKFLTSVNWVPNIQAPDVRKTADVGPGLAPECSSYPPPHSSHTGQSRVLVLCASFQLRVHTDAVVFA